MKTFFAALAICFSTAASSACYMIYTPSNELVWRDALPPVPMNSASVSHEVRKKVPGGHLVIIQDDSAPCLSMDLTKRTTLRQKAEEMKYD